MRRVDTMATRWKVCIALGSVAVAVYFAASLGQVRVSSVPIARSVRGAVAAEVDRPLAGLTPARLFGGSANRADADGTLGFIARNLAVDIVDLAGNPPRAIGRQLFTENVTAIAAEPGRLYVASDRSLIVFDTSRPARLSEVGRWTLPADESDAPRSIGSIAAGGGTIWLSVSSERPPYRGGALVAIDVTDPLRPQSFTEVDMGQDSIGDLVRVGDRLVAITTRDVPNEPFTSDVLVFDVQDPLAVRLIGRAGPFNHAVAASLRGELLYVAVTFSPQLTNRSVETTAGVRVIDIAAPDGPHLKGRWDTGAHVFGMVLQGDHALVTVLRPEDGGTSCIVLTTTDGQPTESGSLPCAQAPGLGFASASVDSAGRLLVAAYTHGWEVWGWPESDPVLLRRSGDGSSAWEVVTDGQRMLVFDGTATRLLRWDGGGSLMESELVIDDQRTFPRMTDSTGALALSRDRAVLAGMEGMVVFDVAATPPRRMGQLAWGLPQMPAQPLVAALVGDFAVVDLYVPGHGIALIDLSDPAHPVRRNTPWDGLPVWDMTVENGRLYVGAGPRLYVFAPGGPDGLTLLGEAHIESPDGDERDVMAVAVMGERAVIGGVWYAAVLDVHDPSNIRTIAEHEMDFNVSDLAFVGQDVVAAGSRNGRLGWEGRLMLLRADTAAVVAEVPTWSNVEGLATIDGVVYAAEGSLGLAAFRPWRLPDGWRAAHRLALPWLSL